MSLIVHPLPNRSYKYCILSALLVLSVSIGYSQNLRGCIKGKVIDVADNRPIQGASVSKRNGNVLATTIPDGSFVVILDRGAQTLSFSANGYRKITVEQIPVTVNYQTEIFIRLEPTDRKIEPGAGSNNVNNDSSITIKYQQYLRRDKTNVLGLNSTVFEVKQHWLNPSIAKDLSSSLNWIPGFNQTERNSTNISTLSMVNGLSGRYVNLFLNGSVQPGLPEDGQMMNLSAYPVEMIDKVSLQTERDASSPGEFGGGNLHISIKDKPDQNFFYLQAGTEFQSTYAADLFYGDKRSFREWSAIPGFTRNLPEGFPGAKSDSRLSQKNPQEKSDLLRTLPNNLSSKNLGNLSPSNRFVLAWGHNYTLRTKQRIGIFALLNHQNQENIYSSQALAAPNGTVNPYPFSNNNATVIKSFSDNKNYQQYSYLTGLIGASIAWNKSKITTAVIFTGSNNFQHSQKNSIHKPDEDSLGTRGLLYKTQQARTINFTVKGDHAFGKTGKFRFEWTVNYNNYKQNNPDERFFLLRQDSVRDDFYEIAHQQTQPLPDRNNVSRSALNANLDAIRTNSYRSWRNLNDHFFTGSAGLSTPVRFLKLNHIMAGGIYMQTHYRELYSDLLLYKGSGYFTIDGLLAPQRYFPGGLDAEEYYAPLIGQTGSFNPNDVNADNYGNYLGSINVGAGYISNETQLGKNLSVKLGMRFETTSQLASLYEYHYFEGFKNPEKITLDENVYVSSFDLLPSASVTYMFHPKFDLSGSYFRSLNRPRMQELTDFRTYDPDNFMVRGGNKLLEISTIDHIRATLTFKPSVFSYVRLNAFYKKIYKPVEYLVTPYAASIGNLQSTPHNMPEATVKGIQGSLMLALSEHDKSFLSKLYLFGNLTLLESKVSRGPLKSESTPFSEEHTLSGTPYYALNGGLVLKVPRYPAVQISFDRTSDYISAVGSGSVIKLVNGFSVLSNPHYYVKGRSLLNAQVSQHLFKSKILLVFGADNLFAEDFIQYQDLNGNKRFDEPLRILQNNGNSGYFSSGIDNAASRQEGLRSYYIRLSYQIQ